jgi:hypothetical protein
MMLRCSRERARGATEVVRDLLVSLAAAMALWGSCFVLAYLCFPEPAEHKLGRLWTEAAQTMPVRTLPPEVPAIRCVMMWVGTAGPELWCPAAPPLPEKPEQPAVPTS